MRYRLVVSRMLLMLSGFWRPFRIERAGNMVVIMGVYSMARALTLLMVME